MYKKYMGIKHSKMGEKGSSNLGLVFEDQGDGFFFCKENGRKVSRAGILHDLKLGYLKDISTQTEDTNNN